MKTVLITAISIFISVAAICQKENAASILPPGAGINEKNLSVITIPFNATTHIVSPEPILYVDISTNDVQGDMPEKNICRLRPDTSVKRRDNFIVTVVTESFVQVYKLVCQSKDDKTTLNTYVITIDPSKAVQLNTYNKVGKQEFYQLTMKALTKNRKIYNLESANMGMNIRVNNIFIVGDFLLFDFSARNKTKLQYDIDEVRFKIMDKYNVNATVSQDIEMKPLYQLYDNSSIIKGSWRNFYVFRKFTFPGRKTFHVEMTEKQLSGRKIELNVDYNQILSSQYLQ